MFEVIALVLGGVAVGVLIQAARSAKATGTSVREQIQRGGGPDPRLPK